MLEFSPRRIGPIRGKLPVAVPGVRNERHGIRMAGNRKLLRHFQDHLGDQFQQTSGVQEHLGAAAREHGQPILIDELNPKPFLRIVDH